MIHQVTKATLLLLTLVSLSSPALASLAGPPPLGYPNQMAVREAEQNLQELLELQEQQNEQNQ